LAIAHNGKHPVYRVTSVLDVARLSEEHLDDVYRQRWGAPTVDARLPVLAARSCRWIRYSLLSAIGSRLFVEMQMGKR
jgi:hypothetical protein